MSEEKFYNSEHPDLPEHSTLPEHTKLPEYNPVYPDVTFFKESSVTTREENIFQGEPPAGETRRVSREEKRKERERFSLLQKILGSALRGGAAVMAAAVAVSAVSFAQEGDLAASIRKLIEGGKKQAFTQQTGYDADALARLWERDPDAPHKYDTEHPLTYKEATCIEDGEAEYVCLECGVHSHAVLTSGGHQEGDPETQDEVAATCLAEGSYVRIIRCKVCGEELSRETITVAKSDHTPGDPERQDEVEPTCTEEGSYAEVIVCSVCGEEISRNVVTVEAKGHTPADAVKEHETAATCTEGGSYEEVILCADCGEEISRRNVTVAALGHQESQPVKEQEVAATCTEGGHYDSVVYCSRCSEELSRNTVTQAALGHSAAAAVKEQEVAATCERAGSYQNVVYCSRCSEELSRETVRVAALGHSGGQAVRENQRLEDCTDGGAYEEVVYCSRCGQEMSRVVKSIAPASHTAGTPVKEWIYGLEDSSGNIIGPDCLDGGEYENVTYCTVCGQEISRSDSVFEDGPGHNFGTSLSNGQNPRCSRCGTTAIYAYYGYDSPYVYYYFDDDWFYGLQEAGIYVQTVKLWCVDSGSYINEGGYEGMDPYGDIDVPDEYREPGTRLRVDIFLTNGVYLSSNTVTTE